MKEWVFFFDAWRRNHEWVIGEEYTLRVLPVVRLMIREEEREENE